MSGTAPPIDSRTADDVAQQIQTLLGIYAPAWHELDPATGRPTGMSAALIGICARFAELTIQRLNQAPDKNQLAFLDMLGATPMPPQPARVPLTFSLAAGATGAIVPARTQVAAAPGPGAKQTPVLFETEQELALTPAMLARIVTWDAPSDRLADHGRAVDPLNTIPVTLFQGETTVSHTLGIQLDALLGFGTLIDMTVHVDLVQNQPAGADARTVQWQIVDGETVTPITPVSEAGGPADSTVNLTQSGDIYFPQLSIAPDLGFVVGRRLQAQLITPLNRLTAAVDGQVRVSQLPQIADVTIRARGICGPFLPDAAFAGATPIDVSRDFYPFGERPQFGATWYIASREVLSRADHPIDLFALYTNPVSGIPVATGTSSLSLSWEFWNGRAWSQIGTSGPGQKGSIHFADGTMGFTAGGSSDISFIFPQPPQPTIVNGIENYWLRVRIIGGAYNPIAVLAGMPASSAPYGPSLSIVNLSFGNKLDAGGLDIPAEALIHYDGMTDAVTPAPFTAFAPAVDQGRSVYLGLLLPASLPGFPQAPVSLYAELTDIPFGALPDNAGTDVAPRLGWAYWDGAAWSALIVSDGTEALTTSGPIVFLPPIDFAPTRLFDSDRLFWLRATWRDGFYTFLPRLRRVLLNTGMGEQAVTVRGEVLGSATGEASQSLTAAQTPILAGVALDVTEGELPGADERVRILADEGPAAIVALPDGIVRVRWHEVNDFYASGPRDRHYVLDHGSGQVVFGDGVAGLIPPRGAGNLVLTYRTGGGDAGNVAIGTIRQLKTTVPYVATVANPAAAAGGVGAEPLSALRLRAPRTVRHGGRAVTAEDFEDMAKLTSPEVARVLAVPLIDLGRDPDGATPLPGSVSVVIVPQSDDVRPFPSVELVDRVMAYLQACALPGLDLVVVGPEYVRVDVHAELSLAQLEGAGAVEAAALAALAAFLDPLTGGADGSGWGFGRRPFRSDIVALLQGIAGVDHLRLLDIAEVPDRAGTEATGRFLVCSGNHRVDLVFGE